MPKKPPKQKTYEVTFKNSKMVLSGVTPGGDLTYYGHMLIDVKDKVTKKYHPIRFYVMKTGMPRILISHAASFWLGLVKVLCDNKAPQIKRQVASIDKKSDFRAKSSPFRTSTSHLGSSSQKKQTVLKTVT